MYRIQQYIHTRCKHFLLAIFILSFASSCSRIGTYSVVVYNKGTTATQGVFNDLPSPYHKKEVIIPELISKMSSEERERITAQATSLTSYQIDTMVKVNVLSLPGIVVINAPQCESSGLAMVLHENSQLRKGGKQIDVKLKYVCADDIPNTALATTDFYKIENSDVCESGFHSIEFQFVHNRLLKKTKSEKLRMVLAVCAKD